VSVFPHPLGCVLWFDFGEPKGNIAYDLSGMGNNGTIYGATRVAGMLSGALSFDGVDDYVETPHSDSIMPSTELTMEAWVRLADPSADQKIVGKTPVGSGYVLGVGDFNIYPEVWDEDGTRFFFRADGIRANEWTHLAATWKTAGRFKGYTNARLKADIAASLKPIGSNTNPLRVGCAPWSIGAFPVDGDIALVRIYNRALTEEEIRAHYSYVRSCIVPEV